LNKATWSSTGPCRFLTATIALQVRKVEKFLGPPQRLPGCFTIQEISLLLPEVFNGPQANSLGHGLESAAYLFIFGGTLIDIFPITVSETFEISDCCHLP